jgi:hypothetical protein
VCHDNEKGGNPPRSCGAIKGRGHDALFRI